MKKKCKKKWRWASRKMKIWLIWLIWPSKCLFWWFWHWPNRPDPASKRPRPVIEMRGPASKEPGEGLMDKNTYSGSPYILQDCRPLQFPAEKEWPFQRENFCMVSTLVWPTDGQMDGPTNGGTDQPADRQTNWWMDIPSYRDERKHLKREWAKFDSEKA